MDKLSSLGEPSEPHENAQESERQSHERPRKGELATISHKFSFVHVLRPEEEKNDVTEIKVD